jgi:non-homologous end joining protein Ku
LEGAFSFGLVNVPVELFSAKRKSAEIDLVMLDKGDSKTSLCFETPYYHAPGKERK